MHTPISLQWLLEITEHLILINILNKTHEKKNALQLASNMPWSHAPSDKNPLSRPSNLPNHMVPSLMPPSAHILISFFSFFV
jgi:hypothetical protein